MLLESGQLEEQHDHFELTGHLQSLAVPSTLHDSLMARLDRLARSNGWRNSARTLGREFSYALLKAVCGWGDDRLRATLDRLVEGNFCSRNARHHTRHTVSSMRLSRRRRISHFSSLFATHTIGESRTR